MFIEFLVYFFSHPSYDNYIEGCIFIFGLCIGSFLNCVIYRLALQNFSFWKNLGGLSRSFCPHCKHILSFKDLFPVFSFLFLRGRCRYCKKNISIQYPLVELVTGLVFLLIFKFLIFNFVNNDLIFKFLNAGFLFYIASALIIIFVYDLKYYIIPDKVLFPAIVITFLFRVLQILNLKFFGNWKLEIGNFAPLSNYLLAIIIGSGFFFLIFLISKGRAMGFGDVKLAVLMGLLLGFPNILTALFLAFFFGAIIGTILIVFEKKNLKSELPFGPFLIAGTFMSLLWGGQLINWYLKLFYF